MFRSHFGEGNGTPLQYSCLENPMDGGAWWAAVHGVAKSWTRLSDFTFTFHFHALEKEMATHSSVLAWRIPGTGEPGGLPSLGLHRVRHDWSDLAAAAAEAIYIFFSGESLTSFVHFSIGLWFSIRLISYVFIIWFANSFFNFLSLFIVIMVCTLKIHLTFLYYNLERPLSFWVFSLFITIMLTTFW